MYFSKLLGDSNGNHTQNQPRRFLGVSINAATISCLCLRPFRLSAPTTVPAIFFCQNPIYPGRFFPNSTFSLKALSSGCDLSFVRTFIVLYSFLSYDIYFGTFCAVVNWGLLIYKSGSSLRLVSGVSSSLPGTGGYIGL